MVRVVSGGSHGPVQTACWHRQTPALAAAHTHGPDVSTTWPRGAVSSACMHLSLSVSAFMHLSLSVSCCMHMRPTAGRARGEAGAHCRAGQGEAGAPLPLPPPTSSPTPLSLTKPCENPSGGEARVAKIPHSHSLSSLSFSPPPPSSLTHCPLADCHSPPLLYPPPLLGTRGGLHAELGVVDLPRVQGKLNRSFQYTHAELRVVDPHKGER